MGNIHLGKEITVINIQEALGDPFGNLKTIADDLSQSFGDLNATITQLDGVLNSVFINDISIAGQEANLLAGTLQNVNTQFQAFLQTYIQSGFLQQIEQLLFLSATEITQLNQSIQGQLMPAIMLLTQDAMIMAKSGGGGESWLGILDHVLSILNSGIGIYSGAKGLFGKGEGLGTKDLINTSELNPTEFKGYGLGYESTSTGAIEFGTSDATAGLLTTGGAELGAETFGEAALAADPLAWLALGVGATAYGVYDAFSPTPYNGELHPIDDYQQHGDANTMAHQQYVPNVDVKQVEAQFRKRNLEAFKAWKQTASYTDFLKAQEEEAAKYPGISLEKAWTEGIFPVDPERKDYQKDQTAKIQQQELSKGREEVEKLIEQGIISPQNAPKLNTYKDLLAYKNKWQPLSPMFSPHGMAGQSPQQGFGGNARTTSQTFNIHVEFHGTYNGPNESLKDIHDKIVQVLTDAVHDAKISADMH